MRFDLEGDGADGEGSVDPLRVEPLEEHLRAGLGAGERRRRRRPIGQRLERKPVRAITLDCNLVDGAAAVGRLRADGEARARRAEGLRRVVDAVRKLRAELRSRELRRVELRRRACMPKPNWPLTKEAPRLRDSPTRITTRDSTSGAIPRQLSTMRRLPCARETWTSTVTGRRYASASPSYSASASSSALSTNSIRMRDVER